MNEIIKFLLAGDKFMPEMHLRQPRFTYSACGPFTKKQRRMKISRKQKIDNILIKTNCMELLLSITCLMDILKI